MTPLTRRHSYSQPRTKKEFSALLEILAATFYFSPQRRDQYAKIAGEKNFRVIRHGAVVAGGCALLPFGQFFGGRSVPMMGVAAVGIAPEHRGRRLGSALMRAALDEMRTGGWPISTLYPATISLYRAVGYEQAGVRYEIRIPAKTLLLNASHRENSCRIQRINPRHHPHIEHLYRERAIGAAGNLDRSAFNWSRVRQPRDVEAQGFMAVNLASGKPEGYVYYIQKDGVEAPYSLHLTDLVALTPAAGRGLLAFLANHRSMTDQIIFHGTADDPILKLLPDRSYSAKLLDHWMVRIVDVKAALEARGYAPAVKANVTFGVRDDLPGKGNDRNFTLEVDGGKAKVRAAAGAQVMLDIRGLASLYTGHASLSDLMAIGLIEFGSKATAEAQILASIFAGPPPWLPDMF